MAFFQLKHVSGYPWPALPDAAFADVWNAYLELDRSQWLAPERIVENQLRQVRALLDHCIRYVPYYRDVLTAAGISPAAVQTMDDFRRIPLLPRRVYEERRRDFLAERLPAGTVAVDPHPAGSGALETNRTRLWWHACYLRDLEWCGIDPTGTLAVVRDTGTTGTELQPFLHGVIQPTWLPALDPLIETGIACIMDVRQEPRLQLAWLRRIAPDYLLTDLANLEALAPLMGTDGPIPRLRTVQAMGSRHSPEAQVALESAIGVPVKITYTCPEAGHLASPCPAGHGWHVHAENVLLEVLDEHDRVCALGRSGRVVVTQLQNLRTPWVRYELADRATISSQPCLCGRSLALIAPATA